MSELNTAATNIYNRLASAPTFHPANANLFTDWNMQAGDVVTVKSDAESYQVPVYNMKLRWTGAPKVEIESTGNPEREPLSPLKRREYSSQHGGYGMAKQTSDAVDGLETRVTHAEVLIDEANARINLKADATVVNAQGERLTQAEVDIDGLDAQIALKASASDVTALGTRMTAAEVDIDGLEGEIVLKASAADVGALGNRVNQCEIDIDAAEGQIALKASASDVTALGNRVTQAEIDIDAAEGQIALKVSEGDVATQLAVECGNVTISGGNLVVNGMITADYLSSNVVAVGGLSATQNILAQGWIVAGSYVNASDVQIEGDSLKDAIVDFGTATSSGGQITIPTTKRSGAAGPNITFNIADTQYYQDGVAAAYARGVNDGGGSISVDRVDVARSGNPTWNSASKVLVQSIYAAAIHEDSGGNEDVLRSATVSVNVPASSAYNAGWSDYWNSNLWSRTSDQIKIPGQTPDSAAYDWFKISETTVYTSGVSAARSAGWTSGYSDGVDAATPDSVEPMTAEAPSLASGTWWSATSVTTMKGEDTLGTYNGLVNVNAPYSAGCTAGQNSVNVTRGDWNRGSIAFTTSAGSGTGASVNLLQGVTEWSDNTATVYINDNGSGSTLSTGKTVTVDASDRYQAGYDAGLDQYYSAGDHYWGYSTNGGATWNYYFSGRLYRIR